MTLGEVMAALDALIQATPPEADACSLLGQLVEREERLRLRLRAAALPAGTNAVERQESSAGRLLTPDEAASIAHVPMSRIYCWARGQRWASRPTRRCLRIEEKLFRRWMESRK